MVDRNRNKSNQPGPDNLQRPPKNLPIDKLSLINFTVVRAASLYCDLNIDTSRTIVGRVFLISHFSSSSPTLRFGLGVQ